MDDDVRPRMVPVMPLRARCQVLLLLMLSPSLMAEDTLERAKREVREPKPSGTSSSDRPSSHDHHHEFDDEDDDDGFGFFFELLGWGIAQCFVWPGDPPAVMGAVGHPYQEEWPGWFAPVGHGRPGKIPGGEVSAEYGRIEDDLQRFTLGGRAMLSAFTIRSEWSRYIEERDDGGHDTLTIGTIDAELGITFASYARLGLGLGATIYRDEVGTEAGACGVVALDVFPVQPVVLGGVFTYGSVGEWDTEIMTLRGTLGVVWNRYELYAGWQRTSIGPVDLEGPTGGVRVWF
jgi:hypothetical protein